jgi:hypothetical protein
MALARRPAAAPLRWRRAAARAAAAWRPSRGPAAPAAAGPSAAASSSSQPDDDDTNAAPELLAQAGPGGWRVAPPAAAGAPKGAAPPPRPLLLVDGTNLAVRCARAAVPGSGGGAGARVAAWLRFLLAATGAAGGAVAFDNKGSSAFNARAALHPGYNRARYRAGGAAGGRGGWAASAGGGAGGGACSRACTSCQAATAALVARLLPRGPQAAAAAAAARARRRRRASCRAGATSTAQCVPPAACRCTPPSGEALRAEGGPGPGSHVPPPLSLPTPPKNTRTHSPNTPPRAASYEADDMLAALARWVRRGGLEGVWATSPLCTPDRPWEEHRSRARAHLCGSLTAPAPPPAPPAHQAAGLPSPPPVVLVSADSDMEQLMGPGVFWWVRVGGAGADPTQRSWGQAR